jgi:acyl-CoA synthetase (AMP-forming)/AMP-acid ligase II
MQATADPPDLAQARAHLVSPGAVFEVGEEEVRGERMLVFRRRHRSLVEMLLASARFPDRAFIVDGEVRLTFGEHLRRVEALAHILKARYGVAAGDRVAIFAANRWEWIVAFWAVLALGAVPAAYNGHWTAEEFVHATDLVEPVLIIGDAPRVERVADVMFDMPFMNLDADLPDLDAAEDRFTDFVLADEDDPSALIFTSGTTGRAKAVTLPHRALFGAIQHGAMSTLVKQVMASEPAPRAEDGVPLLDEVYLVTAPLFHIAMFMAAILPAVYRGFCMVLLRGRFEPERVLAAVERERVTNWSIMGSVAVRLAGCEALARYDTSSLRGVGVGGAPVSPAVQQSLREAFPSAGASLGMGYSSTEAGGASVAAIGGPLYAANPTAAGTIGFTMQVELRDEAGAPVPDGKYGEVHVRSPYLMLGYWNDPVATAKALKAGGWLAMGDIARLEDGLLFINSRARDMIQVNAENVSPTEVEYVLEAHPAIREAAVVAVDDPVTGDAVCAAVVPAGDDAPSEAELDAWCRARLAPFKAPTRWRITRRPLPRTASGKLAKPAIRAWVEAGGEDVQDWSLD